MLIHSTGTVKDWLESVLSYKIKVFHQLLSQQRWCCDVIKMLRGMKYPENNQYGDCENLLRCTMYIMEIIPCTIEFLNIFRWMIWQRAKRDRVNDSDIVGIEMHARMIAAMLKRIELREFGWWEWWKWDVIKQGENIATLWIQSGWMAIVTISMATTSSA